MLGIKKRLFGWKAETLVDHYNLTVERSGDEVVFKPSPYYERNADLVMDDEEYEVDSEMTFSIDYLRGENAVIINSNDLLHSFSTNTVEEDIGLVFSEDQIDNINEITVNKGDNILNPDSEYEFDVFAGGEMFIITVSGFYVNNTVKLDIQMNGAYPSVRVSNVNPDNQLVDLSTMERREFRVESEIGFTGCVKFGAKKLDVTTGRKYNLGRSEKIYCESGEVSDRVEKWNNTDFGVEIRPDSYSPIKTVPDRVVDGTIIVEVAKDDIVSLSQLTVTYPEWVVGIDPRLKYEDIDPHSKYSKREKVGQNKYVFRNVIPFEDLRLFHGGGVMRFEESILDIKPLGSNSEEETQVNLTPKRKSLIINSKRSDTVNLIVDGESRQIESQGATVIEVDVDDTEVTAKSTDNRTIDKVSLSESALSETREITVVDDSVLIS